MSVNSTRAGAPEKSRAVLSALALSESDGSVAFGSPLSFPEKGAISRPPLAGAISRPPLAGAIGCKCDVGQIHSMEMGYQRA
jgi:hypothetical protein